MRLPAAALAVVLVASAAVAQPAFEPLPGGPERYRIDFARHFYATPAALEAERRALDAALRALATREGHLAESAPALARTLEQLQDVLLRSERLSAYLTLRAATDTRDAASREEDAALEARVEARTDAVREELARLAPARAERLAAQVPALRSALPFLARVRAETRPLPAGALKVLEATRPSMDTWQAELRELLLQPVPPLKPDAADERARQEAFTRHYAALQERREPLAFALVRLARARNALAQLRGYADAAEEAYAQRGWSEEQVRTLLAQLASRADLYARYQRLRAEPLGHPAHAWDVGARTAASARPRFTYPETRALLQEVLAPLGPRYGAELSRLLDPEERRLDIAPGPNRQRGGFSKGFPGMTSVFYTSGFNGEYRDVRVLTHESTHAVHRQLMAARPAAALYASGPNFLLEATAIFNELLLPATLAERAARAGDPALRRYYLEQFLEGKGLAVVFITAAEAELEQRVYEGVAAGSVRSADDLDALTRECFTRYAVWPDARAELAAHWMEIPLLYEDPFYDVNYTWAGLLALRLFAAYERDPKRFAPGYVAMMAQGFDRPVEALLRDFVGVELHSPELVEAALAAAGSRLEALQRVEAPTR
ncbi:M3 family oligoendopeptidase [Aggregicoccus sp. 17bor-14]|uniref:M3 family metallopeptidase n=1 Tax=Myxococcaceae TaxID=31 RepID=UPI00129D0EDA|nr:MULTISPECIES: M3 family metallopeptidase [Myxococcaceae]MBF5042112.1 M3 family oligoendopeptidase [Simulacricoccus sp. 17bor-14]MRI87889.1 M3 family oligoendopeptidase [Aggregicoccus sp. 17bor-14]